MIIKYCDAPIPIVGKHKRSIAPGSSDSKLTLLAQLRACYKLGDKIIL